MYRYYDKDKYQVMNHYFDSIYEFIDYIDNTPTSRGFSNSELHSFRTNRSEWYGTSSFEEAKHLATYGYNEDFDKFVDLKLQLEKYIKVSSTRAKQYNYYIGYAPDTKAYLEGNPLSMLNRINPARKQVDIYFNTSMSCATSTSQIRNRGVIALCVVEALERLGFAVNLNIVTVSSSGSQVLYADFRLKGTNERLNIRKLYFPMCHNSWLRRLEFRLTEVTPDISSSWTWGYGTPGDEGLLRSIIDLKPNDIVISQPREMGISGENIMDDANNMFEHINKSRNTQDFELPNLQKVKTR